MDPAPDGPPDPSARRARFLQHAPRLGTPAPAGSARMYVVVAATLAALFSATAFAVDRFQQERAERAREHLEHGQALARQGRYAEAVRWLRASLSLDRGNTESQLALATTLLEAGRAREASAYLGEVLRQDPTSGLANLTRARTARALNEADEAELYYRRAVYGEWPASESGRRLAVRFELVDYLLRRGANDRAVGELTAIEADAPPGPELSARLGPLFLRAGSARRAAEHLRDAVKAAPGDAALWAALNAAEFQQGRHAASIAAGQRALELRPDPETARRVETSLGVLALDPTTRRLGRAERDRRARATLERALALLDGCAPTNEGADSAEVERLRASARSVLDTRARLPEDAVDSALDLAEYIWRATITACPDGREKDPVLAQVIARLSAAEPGQ